MDSYLNRFSGMGAGFYREVDGGGEGGGTGEGSGEGDNGAKNSLGWKAQLPDDLKNHEAFSGFDRLGDAANAYVELLGKSDGAVKVPGESANDDVKAAFYSAMGRPESADGYQLVKPDTPESVVYDESHAQVFAQAAFDAGMSKTQAQALFKGHMDYALKQYSEAVEERRTAEKVDLDALEKDWGEQLVPNIERAHRAFEQISGEEAKTIMEQYSDPETGTRLGQNPVINRLFLRIAELIEEDKQIFAGITGGPKRPTDATGRPMFQSYVNMDKK